MLTFGENVPVLGHFGLDELYATANLHDTMNARDRPASMMSWHSDATIATSFPSIKCVQDEVAGESAYALMAFADPMDDLDCSQSCTLMDSAVEPQRTPTRRLAAPHAITCVDTMVQSIMRQRRARQRERDRERARRFVADTVGAVTSLWRLWTVLGLV